MQYNGLIFDLDGVLCFTDRYHYLAWKRMAQEEGIPFDRQTNDRLRGIGRMESLEIILENSSRRYTQAEKEVLAQRKNGYYRHCLEQMTREDLAPDAVTVLRELRRRGYRVALGSSSRNARLILDRLGLTGYFDAVSDGEGLRHPKPDPEVFLRAAAGLELVPTRCLVVEDARAGVEAAVRGGFASAALGDARFHPEAAYRLDRLSQLLEICA